MPESPFGADVGKQPGLEIWRIENFAPVLYDKKSYGKFYSGDSYIVLNTRLSGDKLKWDIHFWLGKDTSQDEMGAAAIFAVELDDHLGGVPVQHREVQEYESSMFLANFPGGVRYLDGGVASGFKHVDPDQVEKKLLQVKGKRNVRIRQVPLDVSSMNKGDCFVLDAGKVIYVYMGNGSKKIERLKAIQAANQVRDQDHAGKARIVILDEFSGGGDITTFFNELGSGSPMDVPEGSTEDDDILFEKQQQSSVILFRVSDASGQLVIEEIGQKPLQQSMLKREDCFILDTAGSGLFVWIGRGCTKAEKLEAMNVAQKFLTEKGYPIWTKVNRVVDGGEPTIFKQYFASWKEETTTSQFHVPVPTKNGRIAEFNVSSLHRDKLRLLLKQGGAAPGFSPDDGSGQKEIYRVENFELAPVDPSAHGMFFGGDSYVIKYTYNVGGKNRYIIYFWQGNDSSQDEKAASAIHAMRLDNEVAGKAVQVRLTQGNEPRHFIKMFKGKMIIFTGGHASGFRNIHDYDSYDVDGTRLFHVRGYGADDMRAVQVAETASSLNSDDVFVLETPSKTYLWNGVASSDDEKSLGVEIANLVSPGRDLEPIKEGEEPQGFWDALGGKGPYTTVQPDPPPVLKARLFHCILNIAGRLRVEEIKPFKQEDLVDDDVMVLDSGHEIYVWIGLHSTDQERAAGFKMAQEYLKTEPSQRSVDSTLIFMIHQRQEPESFTDVFPTWNRNMWKEQKTYEQIKAEIMASNGVEDDE
ncbi:gelsolin, cytoplasmic-like [Daphnia carinata]|uniref:gelsolin, cytoplasmic-like n=1 Tax=Daphnia carinata TaxID=120202 RepID=UPI00257ED3EB|nr:gelsolin, cytoplasmic-like [Daphnia carinata]